MKKDLQDITKEFKVLTKKIGLPSPLKEGGG
jgi:hypothetical protein